jgi:hypothetical protein
LPALQPAFSEGKGTGANARFCSILCQNAFDAGYVHREPKPRYNLPPRGDGFLISCKGCRRPFVSKGLRCCSTECERQMREKAEIAATMAEVGMEPVAVERRKCEHCSITIPRWRNGRQVPKGTRFCSRSCREKAGRQSGGPTPDLRRESA